MNASTVSSLFFLCLLLLLLLAPHGASSHASYRLGSRQVFYKTPGKSSGNSQEASTVPTATTCSTTGPGLGNNKLPVVHRRSPCSPLHGLPSLTVADVLYHDASLILRRFSSQSSLLAAPTPSQGAIIIPANGSSYKWTPTGTLEYSVLVSYGTPEQQFTVSLTTTSIGASVLRCKPCTSGSMDCDPAFDTSQSSTFAHVLCDSPNCPTNYSGIARYEKGSFARDVLTLAPSMSVNDFIFFCMDVDEPSKWSSTVGTLDLSMDRNSLPSQLLSSQIAPTDTFSYCLPQYPSSQGFLSLGVDAAVRDDYVMAHAPLVSNGEPKLATMYFLDLVGMSLGDEDLLIPAGTLGNKINLDVGFTFTWLWPDVYTQLRDSFLQQMLQYNNLSSSSLDDLDTCFNFTGLNELIIPLLQLNFSNGDSLVIEGHQMLYYDEPDKGPFSMACLAFLSLDAGNKFSPVIGTYTLASTEVVYDVAGGKVGFIPRSC